MERIDTAHKNNDERVTSTYAETYFNDDYCDYQKPDEAPETTEAQIGNKEGDEWKSPSDLLIDIVDLTPPFTSKITRGVTHQGILAIGNGILEKENERFLKYMNKLMSEHSIIWNQILKRQKIMIAEKVKRIYEKMLDSKTKILISEINTFYESTLQELENHLRQEVTNVLTSMHASIKSDANAEIHEKLENEKQTLEKVLQQRYENEVKKINHYYKLILKNEEYRNNKLVNQALCARNDALKAFYSQMESEKITSTMYVLCTERKKCRMKQFLLDKHHSVEIAEKLKKLQQQQEIIDSYKEREKSISDLNTEWQHKIKKILQLFLKFISFSLKLLPEQTTFLLDLEKMFVLQLNEIQKSPSKTSSILIDKNDFNEFKFEEVEQKATICDKDPFTIVGDTSESTPTQYGSRETLASNVDLPMVRLQRKFIYAKCDKFAEVKALLEAQRCKCRDPIKVPSFQSPKEASSSSAPSPTTKSESSNELLLMDDITILHDCPVRRCQDPMKTFSFPNLRDYLDFTEENYERVKTVIGGPQPENIKPEVIDPRDVLKQELPFGVTHEKYHNVATQCSSEEDVPDVQPCPCTKANSEVPQSSYEKTSRNKEIDDAMKKRVTSLQRLIQDNPNLLKIFTEESFDFVYSIK